MPTRYAGYARLVLDSSSASHSDPISWILRSTRLCSSTNTAAASTAVNLKHMDTSCFVPCLMQVMPGRKGDTASMVTPTTAARAESPGVTEGGGECRKAPRRLDQRFALRNPRRALVFSDLMALPIPHSCLPANARMASSICAKCQEL